MRLIVRIKNTTSKLLEEKRIQKMRKRVKMNRMNKNMNEVLNVILDGNQNGTLSGNQNGKLNGKQDGTT